MPVHPQLVRIVRTRGTPCSVLPGDVDETAPSPLSYEIAGLRLRVHPERAALDQVRAAYEAFVVPSGGDAAIDVVSQVADSARQTFASTGPVQAGTPHWSTSLRDDGGVVFRLHTPPPDLRTWRLVVGLDHATRWQIITAERLPYVSPRGLRPHPLAFPTAELLLMEVLRRRGGALMHACGVVDGGVHGLLFCGRSGAGKTTTARLWQRVGATVLNDDRTIVRTDLPEITIFGTPWHGDLPQVANAGAPLRGIFILRHAERPSLHRLVPGRAVRELLSCCWPPIWAPGGGLDLLLPLFRGLAERVPIFELAFAPDETAVELVRAQIA